jgi:hypothetical protein
MPFPLPTAKVWLRVVKSIFKNCLFSWKVFLEGLTQAVVLHTMWHQAPLEALHLVPDGISSSGSAARKPTGKEGKSGSDVRKSSRWSCVNVLPTASERSCDASHRQSTEAKGARKENS